MTRRVLFITGTRADFGKIKALVRQVQQSEDFEYGIFATGMHLLARYGSTLNEIYKAGFQNVYPYINQDGAIASQMDLNLANTIQGLGHYVREFTPDLIVVHGDRVEALAGAIVGALNNILVAHIEGGEVSGTVDELIRHAVTKLSHLHFVANAAACRRLIQMGENPESVFVIGSPDVDVMLSEELPSLAQAREKYAIGFDAYAILAYHSVTTELPLLRAHVQTVLNALEASELNFLTIYPNNDSGAEIIFEELARLVGHPRFRIIPSIRFEYFLTLLRHAQAIVGNSSAGIREAPVYGVPTVNIGTRQSNRYAYPSIANIPEEREAILHALRNLPQAVPPSLDFGKGDSARLFMEQLHSPRLWDTPRQKQFRDLAGDWSQ